MLSDTAEYALRATLYVAQEAVPDRPVTAEEIASAVGAPRNYVSKTLHILGQEGILTSTRGPKGGFRLARPADEVTLFEVVRPFDRLQPGRSCILGRSECNDQNPCPAHDRWKGISEEVSGFFRSTTLEDLLKEPGKALT